MAETTAARQRQLNDTFVALADTLVNGFDIVELLDRLVTTCVEVLGSSAAGLMLSDQRGHLRVMAASSESMRLLELMELQNAEGPCLDCFTSGAPVELTALADAEPRWPQFVSAARGHGFAAVQAFPLRLRETTIGALNVLYAHVPATAAVDASTAQALADVATIGILQQRTIHRSNLLAEQLQTALTSRLVIEQAKGLLAERGGYTVDEAFEILRDYCRANRLALSETANRLVVGEIEADYVLAHRGPSTPDEPTGEQFRRDARKD